MFGQAANVCVSAAAPHHRSNRHRPQANTRSLSYSPVFALKRCVHAEVTHNILFRGDQLIPIELEFQPIFLVAHALIGEHGATVP
jgi:hypothetical protein